VEYPITSGKPLSRCVSNREEIHNYNKIKGITNYINPYVSLFCVKYDRTPAMGNYWQINDAEITKKSVEFTKLKKDAAFNF
jgi:hypothetical protein